MPFYEAYGQSWGSAIAFLLRRYQHFLGEVERLATQNKVLQLKNRELESHLLLMKRDSDKRRITNVQLQNLVDKQKDEINELKSATAFERVRKNVFYIITCIKNEFL